MSEIAQEIVDIIVANADKDENTILGEIIGAGVPFTKARATMNAVMVEQGLRLTKEQREEKAAEILDGWEVSEDTTVEDVNEMLEKLSDELKCTSRQAGGYIKQVFSDADLTMPKAAKVARKRTPGFHGDAKLVSDFLIENPECTQEDVTTFMQEQGIDKSKNGADKTKRFWNFVVELKTFADTWCDSNNCK